MSSVNPALNISFGSHMTSRFSPGRVQNHGSQAAEAKLGLMLSSGEIPTRRFPPVGVKSDEIIDDIRENGYHVNEATLGFTISSGENATLRTRARSASLLSNSATKIPTLTLSNREKDGEKRPAPHHKKQS